MDARSGQLASEAELLYELIATGRDIDCGEPQPLEQSSDKQHEVDIDAISAELARRRNVLDGGVPRHSRALPTITLPELCTCIRCKRALKVAIASAPIDPYGWLSEEQKRLHV